ncbi:MAG: hypothetical protein DHS20C01_11700 [marine bacterium B5-7]|nr:MAG: hypothetical protein DHS20C01_11700 [marine bacterium B5-7]
MHGQVADIFLVENDVSLVTPDKTANHIETGGLTRAVGAQKANHFAVSYGHVDVSNHVEAAVRLAKIAGNECSQGEIALNA